MSLFAAVNRLCARPIRNLPLGLMTALSLLAGASAAQAAGRVEVVFIEPERFTDIGWPSLERQRHLAILDQHMKAWAPQLADGQVLQVQVTDVDLAGELRPTRRWPDVRVMAGRVDWPRISLQWSLSSPGQADRSGSEDLADMAYLETGGLRLRHTEALAYDRRMLDRWFEARLLQAQPARR